MNKKIIVISLSLTTACLIAIAGATFDFGNLVNTKGTSEYTNSVNIDASDVAHGISHGNTFTKNGITFELNNISVENNRIIFDGLDGSVSRSSSPEIRVTTLSLPVVNTLSGGGYTNVGVLGYDGTEYGKLGVISYGGEKGKNYIGYVQVKPNKPELQNITPATNTDYQIATKVYLNGKVGYDLGITSFTLSWACKYAYPPVDPSDKKIYVTSPIEGELVDTLDPKTRSYINDFRAKGALKANDYLIDINEVNTTDHTPRAQNYYDSSVEYNNPVKISFYSGAASGTTFNISYSMNSDLSDAKVISTTLLENKIYNLEPDTTYYYQIVSSNNEYSSPIRSFKTKDGFRTFHTEKTSNIRDIGGLMTKSGKRIKYGLVYRGPELNKEQYIASSGSTHHKTLVESTKTLLLDELGILQEVDFRSASEVRDTSQLTSDLDLTDYWSSCMETSTGWTPAYSYICKDALNLSMHKIIFKRFLNVDEKPLYMHCVGGLDRTGTVAFLLEGMLGVSFTDVCLDYELSSFSGTARYRDVNCASDGFVNMITHMYNNSAKSATFEGFDPDGTHDLQTVCTNILLKCGITQSEIDTIKSIMLED